jgi:hypothetical protein
MQGVSPFLNAGMSDCPASSQSGTRMNKNANAGTNGIRGSSPVLECSGTGLRYRMPEYRCRRHRPRSRCPAMPLLYSSYKIGKLIFFLEKLPMEEGDLLGFSLCLYHFNIHGWLSTLLSAHMHAYLVTQDASSTYKCDVCEGRGFSFIIFL